LGRSVKVNNGRGKSICCNGIIEPLRFKHVKTLALIVLKDVQWNMLTFSPQLDLGDK